jgi:hypothetical protein
MIKLTAPRILFFICFACTLGLISACDKDNDDVNSGQVQLLSFGPTGAKHGDTLWVIGTNLQKVTSIELQSASIPKADFKKHSSEEILAIIPASAEKGFITLKTDDGDVVSKTQLNFGVEAVVTSITAQARPGENITIKGNYLNWVKKVVFARDKSVETFVSKTITELVVKVPEDAQTGPLVISYGGTDSMDIETEDTLKVTLPAVTGLAPNPVKHQTNVTITGTNLDLVKQLSFNGVAAPVAAAAFVSQSATEIVVKVPGGTKTGKLTMGVASGVTVSTSQDLQVLLPAITTLAPNPIDPLANLTITGTNLDLVTGVAFTGITNAVTTFESQTATSLVVKVPTGTLKGKVTLNVLNSSLVVESSQVLEINGGLPPLPDFAHAIYTDGVQNGFQDWSWATRDFNSTQIVRQGTVSIKATYGGGGYEGITFHNDNGPATDGYTKLEFSIFGGAGTEGKKINVVINGGWSNPPQVTLVEGAWTTYSLNISSLPSPNPLKEIVLQSAGWTGIVHIDHVGLR